LKAPIAIKGGAGPSRFWGAMGVLHPESSRGSATGGSRARVPHEAAEAVNPSPGQLHPTGTARQRRDVAYFLPLIGS